jgi:hypothetical protein
MQRIHGRLRSSVWGFSRGVSLGALTKVQDQLDVAELVPYQRMGYVAYRRPDLDAVGKSGTDPCTVMSMEQHFFNKTNCTFKVSKGIPPLK